MGQNPINRFINTEDKGKSNDGFEPKVELLNVTHLQ